MEWSVYSRLSKLGCELELLGGEFPLLASLAESSFPSGGGSPVRFSLSRFAILPFSGICLSTILSDRRTLSTSWR